MVRKLVELDHANANRRMPRAYVRLYLTIYIYILDNNDDIDKDLSFFKYIVRSFMILDEGYEDASGLPQVDVDPYFAKLSK